MQLWQYQWGSDGRVFMEDVFITMRREYPELFGHSTNPEQHKAENEWFGKVAGEPETYTRLSYDLRNKFLYDAVHDESTFMKHGNLRRAEDEDGFRHKTPQKKSKVRVPAHRQPRVKKLNFQTRHIHFRYIPTNADEGVYQSWSVPIRTLIKDNTPLDNEVLDNLDWEKITDGINAQPWTEERWWLSFTHENAEYCVLDESNVKAAFKMTDGPSATAGVVMYVNGGEVPRSVLSRAWPAGML